MGSSCFAVEFIEKAQSSPWSPLAPPKGARTGVWLGAHDLRHPQFNKAFDTASRFDYP
jgi:hypothetical protein